MRYERIHKSTNIVVRIASWIMKRKFGKSITPLLVIYARKPSLLLLSDKMEKYQDGKIQLSDDIKYLIKTYTSFLNGCRFCNDLSLANVVRKKLGEQKFISLSSWETDNAHSFTKGEIAVLHFIKEYATEKKVSDETFKEMNEHFSEKQVIDIVTLNAIEHFYNALNIPFNIDSDGLAELQREMVTKNVNA